jgi:hypothetical protein
MIVYKVVRKERGLLFSARAWKEGFKLNYIPNVNTKPKIGRILAFDTLENAKDFREFDEQIWKCYTRRVKPCPPILSFSSDLLPDIVRLFWKGGIHNCNCTVAPKGSVSCSSLMLVKRVV